MNEDLNIKAMSQLVDAIITARQSVKAYIMPRIKDIEGYEISYEMFQVLNVLWRRSDRNQQEIAHAVQKSKASLTPLIDNLVKINLVTRTEDPNDRRNKIISLTEQGKLYKSKFDPLLVDFYTVFKGDMPYEKIQELTSLLLQLSDNVTK